MADVFGPGVLHFYDPNISHNYDNSGEHDYQDLTVGPFLPDHVDSGLAAAGVNGSWSGGGGGGGVGGGNASRWNATASLSDSRDQLCEMRWELFVKLACVPLFVLMGLVGNTLSFIVMFSPVYARKSYSYYLRALAVSDTLTLVIMSVALVNEATFELTGHRILDNHTSFSCKLTEFLRDVIHVVSSWLIVCFTVDRYIAVCHPLQRARLCTESGAVVTMCVLVLLAMGAQFYVFVYVERVDRDNLNLCHAPQVLRAEYYALRYFWFSFTLRFMAPFLIVAVCNGLIIFHIKRMRHRHGTRERDKARNASMAIYTLYVVSAVFVLTLFPNAIISIILVSEFFIYRRSALYCRLLMFDTPFQMVRMINYSMNFVLYGLTGRQFRREVRKLVQCRMHFSDINDRVRDLMLQKIYAKGNGNGRNGYHGPD